MSGSRGVKKADICPLEKGRTHGMKSHRRAHRDGRKVLASGIFSVAFGGGRPDGKAGRAWPEDLRGVFLNSLVGK